MFFSQCSASEKFFPPSVDYRESFLPAPAAAEVVALERPASSAYGAAGERSF